MAKRWILGTHRGVIDHAPLHDDLGEFVFRFNQRHSRSRGTVFYRVRELAVQHAPVRYEDIAAGHRPRTTPPKAPSSPGKPASPERAAADRPRAVRKNGEPWGFPYSLPGCSGSDDF